MIIKKITKNDLLSANVLLKEVKIIFASISEKNISGMYPTNMYECTIVIPKNSEKLLKLKDLCNSISLNNNKETELFKFRTKTTQQIKDFQEKINNEVDENKLKYMTITLEDYKNCEFFKVNSQFEIPVIDITGKQVEDLSTVVFNNQIVNIQITLNNLVGKNKYGKYRVGQYLIGIQLIDVIRKGGSNLMFETKEDELPF